MFDDSKSEQIEPETVAGSLPLPELPRGRWRGSERRWDLLSWARWFKTTSPVSNASVSSTWWWRKTKQTTLRKVSWHGKWTHLSSVSRSREASASLNAPCSTPATLRSPLPLGSWSGSGRINCCCYNRGVKQSVPVGQHFLRSKLVIRKSASLVLRSTAGLWGVRWVGEILNLNWTPHLFPSPPRLGKGLPRSGGDRRAAPPDLRAFEERWQNSRCRNAAGLMLRNRNGMFIGTFRTRVVRAEICPGAVCRQFGIPGEVFPGWQGSDFTTQGRKKLIFVSNQKFAGLLDGLIQINQAKANG